MHDLAIRLQCSTQHADRRALSTSSKSAHALTAKPPNQHRQCARRVARQARGGVDGAGRRAFVIASAAAHGTAPGRTGVAVR
eukprot:4090539-Pleurochrysis_carterae.AAC.3